MTTKCVPAEWTDDCQGKKDYDAPLVSLSTRYWPRGGGFAVLSQGRGWEDNDARPNIRPSARAKIILHTRGDDSVIAEQYFEHDTEEAVKAAVEEWAEGQYLRVYQLMHALQEMGT